MRQVSRIRTAHLDVACLDEGKGPRTALLVHGWPDDPGTWDAVVPALHARGFRTIRPWLRGCGPTRFLDDGAMRSGQISALGCDLIELIRALDLRDFVLVGHDWGARMAYLAASQLPERLRGLLCMSVGYGTNAPDQVLSIDQARMYWYHWYFALPRGRDALAGDRRGFVSKIWRLWSPGWRFTAQDLDAACASFANPDWIDITIHSYRHRWGNAPGDPRYESAERLFGRSPRIDVPTVLLHGADDGATLPETSAGKESFFGRGYARTVLAATGHFVQRERPQAVIEAILSLAR